MGRLLFLIILTIIALPDKAVAQRRLAGEPFVRVVPEVLVSGCPSEPVSAISFDPFQPGDFLTLQRTQCFGSCPVYTVKIDANGQVTWQGERSVQMIGAASAALRPADARALMERLRANGFSNLCGSYSSRATDASTVITTLHVGNREKRVSNYMNTAPGWLQALEYEIDALADTHRWIHGDPQTEVVAFVRTPGATVDVLRGPVSAGLTSDARGAKPRVTPLMRASAKGESEEVRRQLSLKIDPNEQDSSGWTALMYATQAQNTDVMKMLLEAGANPNARSHMGQTAIMAVSAAFYSAPDKFRLLAAAGADIDARDVDGRTALTFAMSGSLGRTGRNLLERVELVTLLRAAGASVDVPDVSGLTVIDYLEEEARRYSQEKANADRLRQILQN